MGRESALQTTDLVPPEPRYSLRLTGVISEQSQEYPLSTTRCPKQIKTNKRKIFLLLWIIIYAPLTINSRYFPHNLKNHWIIYAVRLWEFFSVLFRVKEIIGFFITELKIILCRHLSLMIISLDVRTELKEFGGNIYSLRNIF